MDNALIQCLGKCRQPRLGKRTDAREPYQCAVCGSRNTVALKTLTERERERKRHAAK